MKGAPGVIVSAIVTVTILSGLRASAAALYPTAPAGTSVLLDHSSFIQYVPSESPGLPNPNPVIDDTLGQHPGAFGIGFPTPGQFFVGVFGDPIDPSAGEGVDVYLWEVEFIAPGEEHTFPWVGPLVQVGFWDGATFQPYGSQVRAWYWDTGQRWLDDPDWALTGPRPILSSRIPWSSFVDPGFSHELNAVEVTATYGHIMVNAVAAAPVPEPRVTLLLCGGLTVLFICRGIRRPFRIGESMVGSRGVGRPTLSRRPPP